VITYSGSDRLAANSLTYVYGNSTDESCLNITTPYSDGIGVSHEYQINIAS